MKQGSKYMALAAFMLAALWTLRAEAAFETREELSFTLGGFSLDEDEGQAVPRWAEYRDIARGGGTLKRLSASRAGATTLTWWGEVANLGYQDAEGSLRIQWGARCLGRFEVEKTPHYLDGSDGTVRERSLYGIQINPLGRIGGGLSYEFDDLTGSLNGAAADREWDQITVGLNGQFGAVDANFAYSDSKMAHQTGGYDGDGVSLRLSGANARTAATAWYAAKDYESNVPSVVSKDIETTRAGFWGRHRLFDYFDLNASASHAEIENGNSNGLGFETNKYRIGAALKLSYARLGFNYTKKNVDKTNAAVDNNEYETHEVYLKGKLDKTLDFRGALSTTDKSSAGAARLTLQNAEDLASHTGSVQGTLTWRPLESLTLTCSASSKDVDFDSIHIIGITERSVDTRHQSAVWRASRRLTFSSDYLYQKLFYRGAVGTTVAGGLTSPLDYRTVDLVDRYSLGAAWRLSDQSSVGLAYDQARSKIGDFIEPNRVVERNVEASYEREFGGGLNLRLAVNHNSYFDALDAPLSGASDLFEIELSKTISY